MEWKMYWECSWQTAAQPAKQREEDECVCLNSRLVKSLNYMNIVNKSIYNDQNVKNLNILS